MDTFVRTGITKTMCQIKVFGVTLKNAITARFVTDQRACTRLCTLINAVIHELKKLFYH